MSIHSHIEKLKADGIEALAAAQLAAYEARYEAVVGQGLRDNPLAAPAPDTPQKRGRPKRC